MDLPTAPTQGASAASRQTPYGTPQNASPYNSQAQTGYIPNQQATPAKPATTEKEEVVTPCGSWSEFFRCPLIIYSVLAFVFFFADIWAMYQASQRATGSSFWVTGLLSLLIYLVLIFLFGYWIKKKCEDCKTGQSWLIFLLAIFFPIILGFAVNVIIGAFAGGLAYLATSMGRGKSSGKTPEKTPAPAANPAPAAAPGAPSPGAPVTVPPPVNLQPNNILGQAMNQLRNLGPA